MFVGIFLLRLRQSLSVARNNSVDIPSIPGNFSLPSTFRELSLHLLKLQFFTGIFFKEICHSFVSSVQISQYCVHLPFIFSRSDSVRAFGSFSCKVCGSKPPVLGQWRCNHQTSMTCGRPCRGTTTTTPNTMDESHKQKVEPRQKVLKEDPVKDSLPQNAESGKTTQFSWNHD